MKLKQRLIFITLLLISTVPSFSKELEGIDLYAVTQALNSKLYIENYEEFEDRITYLQDVTNQIQELYPQLSPEAKLITETILLLQSETVKTTQQILKAQEEQENKKNRQHFEPDPQSKEIILGCYEKLENFSKENPELSSHFYFHLQEARFSTMPFLQTKQQLQILTTTLDTYKSIEEINPELSENLFTLAMVLYFLPGAFGGNKKTAKEKILKSIDTAICDYEKVNSLIAMSQLLYEEKQIEESSRYVEMAASIVPENHIIKELKEMNQAGYSMLQADKYQKLKKKESKTLPSD